MVQLQPSALVAPDLQRLKQQFPQYKTNSLLYVLRRHKFDAAAAQRTLLTSSNTRFWRDFHSCGQGLVGIGEIKPARRNPLRRPVASAPPAPASPPPPVEQTMASELIDALFEAALEEAAGPMVEPEPEPEAAAGDVEEDDGGAMEDEGEGGLGGLAGASAGLGEALDTYRCALKLSAEGRYSESIPLLEQCVEVFESELPADSTHTVQAVARLMSAYKADGNRAAGAAAAGR